MKISRNGAAIMCGAALASVITAMPVGAWAQTAPAPSSGPKRPALFFPKPILAPDAAMIVTTQSPVEGIRPTVVNFDAEVPPLVGPQLDGTSLFDLDNFKLDLKRWPTKAGDFAFAGDNGMLRLTIGPDLSVTGCYPVAPAAGNAAAHAFQYATNKVVAETYCSDFTAIAVDPNLAQHMTTKIGSSFPGGTLTVFVTRQTRALYSVPLTLMPEGAGHKVTISVGNGFCHTALHQVDYSQDRQICGLVPDHLKKMGGDSKGNKVDWAGRTLIDLWLKPSPEKSVSEIVVSVVGEGKYPTGFVYAYEPPVDSYVLAKGDGTLRMSLTQNDYPAAASRRNLQGKSEVSLTIGADGRVQKCALVRSSGALVLDLLTCELVLKSGHFAFAPNLQLPDRTLIKYWSVTWGLSDPSENESVPSHRSTVPRVPKPR